MKNCGFCGFIFALLFVTPLILLSQSQEVDVIYLKNGKTISGKIVERIPDKTIVIETKEGIEFIDYVDIKRIQKEFIPKIDNFSPQSGEIGITISITGSFPVSQPKEASVTIGDKNAEILFWKKDKIDVKVPDLTQKDHPISVQIGNQKDIARMAFTVTAPTMIERGRVQKKVPQQEIADEGYNTGGFWMLLGYVMPQGEFAGTENPTDGFAKKGFSIGYEGRIHLSQNFYLPLNFQVSYAGINIEELQKKIPITISSEGKSYGTIWFTGGLGFAIPMSSSSYLFISGDYGITMVHRPDIKFGTTSYSNYKSVNTFTGGNGFSAGITFSDSFTFGYRTFSAKPKHKVEVSYSGSTTPQEVEIEQQVDIGMLYIAFVW